MPELPEVLAIRHLLRERFAVHLAPRVTTVWLRDHLVETRQLAVPLMLNSILSKGKQLALMLSDSHAIMVHLMLHGRMDIVYTQPDVMSVPDLVAWCRILTCVDPTNADVADSVCFLLILDQGVSNSVDGSVSAVVQLVSAEKAHVQLAQLAPSLDEMTEDDFCRAVTGSQHNRHIESTLTDQRALVSGVGSWLRARMFHTSGVAAKTKAKALSASQARHLYRAGIGATQNLVSSLLAHQPQLRDMYALSKRMRTRI